MKKGGLFFVVRLAAHVSNGLKLEDVFEVTFQRFGENDRGRFGIFVKLPQGGIALMRKKNASKGLESYEETTFFVKIIEIKEKDGRKQYSVTDRL